MSASLQAAAVSVDITPDLNRHDIHLHGYGARGGKIAEGIHDPLHGKVLLLELGDTRTAIITLDILQFDALFRADLIASAAVPGLTEENVLVTASHTHSAPAALQKRSAEFAPRLKWYHEDYYQDVIAALAGGIRRAVSLLQPAVYTVQTLPVGHLMRNRRVPGYDYSTRGFNTPPEIGETLDDQLVALCFMPTDRSGVMATLVNLAGHGTVLGADNMLISADWAGAMQRQIESQLGGICLYANSAEGDVAPDCGSGPLTFSDAESFGAAIAGKVITQLQPALAGSDLRAGKVLTMSTRQVRLPERQVPVDSPYLQAKLPAEVIQAFIESIYPAVIAQSVMRLDDIGIATVPGEMLTSLCLDFKSTARNAGINYPMIFGLGNDSIGYIMTPQEYHKGGYEQQMCLYGPQLGPYLIEQGLTALTDLFSPSLQVR